MRKFFSYGSISTKLHYYVPRQALIDDALHKLVGEDPVEGGHYITIWAPRQRGKTWVMEQVLFTLRDDPRYQDFDVVHLPLESLKLSDNAHRILQRLASDILRQLGLPDIRLQVEEDFDQIFRKEILTKPLILILDEFDALIPEAISSIVSVFRNIHFRRRQQSDKPTNEKDYLLHGVALIGVRAVLGIENKTGSPFNVQQSIHIPNLTFAEVDSMFKWYEQESGQGVAQAVIDQVFYETNGQPGLVGWLGELLTETYNQHNPSITMRDFDITYAAAVDALPNSNIINIISKAKQHPYQSLVLRLFQTNHKIPFRYDEPHTNFLYMNGVVDQEIVNQTERYLKFPSPFVQKRLFNYFASTLFMEVGQLHPPLASLDDVFTASGLNIKNLLKYYETYLHQNRNWLFKDAPRRHDLRIYEAVYHFNFYKYLTTFFQSYDAKVWPEFPTGNGKIDIMIDYQGDLYALEVKSFANKREYEKGLQQAVSYAAQLGLSQIILVLFIEAVDDKSRAIYQTPYHDPQQDVQVIPVFIATGSATP